MAFADDVVDWITGEITTIGLASGSLEANEITGGGYAPIAPDYPASGTDGESDISAPLEFSGPPNQSITHAIFRRAAGVWFIRPLDAPDNLNSDGRWDMTSAAITNAIV